MRIPIPGRFRPLVWLLVVFLALSMLTRIALVAATGAGLPHTPLLMARVLVLGLGFDLVTYVYFAIPLVLLTSLLPERVVHTRTGRGLVGLACFLALLSLGFVAIAEWTFWEEFQSRFNFIAVDYLVYTQEVLGNIRQSYPVGAILTGLVAVCAATFVGTRRLWWMHGARASGRVRVGVVVGWALLATLATYGVTSERKDGSGNRYADQLAGDGIYEFFAAYRTAELDYRRFYRTLPDAQAEARVRGALATPDAEFLHPHGIVRRIRAGRPERRLNVVLVSVESLSAEYSATYGRPDSLTPNLDALTSKSLLFTRLYATGTRTVRGLEALSLSVPPTPGESIVKRDHNERLFSLASVFNAKGYASGFVYGGYGRFDNMDYFFGQNGYDVHDREQIPSSQIHHENIWGVADEDLYTLAMGTFDRAHAQGKPFFAHLMTTSNHRPYTFPAGRGPWPQKQRESAVQYTDWAIADFLRRAKSHAWFDDTVFVFTADHCASSAGKADLPAFRYHIPLWIYSPKHVAPGRFDGLMSQIDIAPTLLGLLGFDYTSRFYGVDVMRAPPQRAFIGTYELLGYLRDGELLQLSPRHDAVALHPSLAGDASQPRLPDDPALAAEAIAFYQQAADDFRSGRMRLDRTR
ncbi:LTA synthase family protein [Lysobacter xanthus]